jgi:transcriptional regulator of acetoin/glycerol metabolism
MKKNTLRMTKRIYQSNTIFSTVQELPTIKDMVDSLVDEAVSRTNNLIEASRILGISRQALCKRIKYN